MLPLIKGGMANAKLTGMNLTPAFLTLIILLDKFHLIWYHKALFFVKWITTYENNNTG